MTLSRVSWTTSSTVARCQDTAGAAFVSFRDQIVKHRTNMPSPGEWMIKDWSLTSLKEKLIKIGAKLVSHGRYVEFQMAEVAISKMLFAKILRLIAEMRPPPDPARA